MNPKRPLGGFDDIFKRTTCSFLSIALIFISVPGTTHAAETDLREPGSSVDQPIVAVENPAVTSTASQKPASQNVLFPDQDLVLFKSSAEEEIPEAGSSVNADETLAAGSKLTTELAAAGAVTRGDTKAPRISNILVSNLSSTSVSLQWKTNEAGTTQASYGLTSSYGNTTPLDSTLVLTHTVVLNNLNPETTYHYQLLSRDAAGNLARSSDLIFTTIKAPDTVGPVISAVTSSNVTRTGATITWATNETSDSQIEYGLTTSYGSLSALDSALVLNHSQNLSSLQAGQTYHFRIRSKDQLGNLTISQDYTFRTADPDLIAPVISQVTTTAVESLAFTVNWLTDELSDSQVEYGTTDTYGNLTTLNTTRVTSHTQTLTGLQASTVYHFRVRSRDIDGNISYSNDYTVTTLPPDVTPPLITNVATSSVLSTKFNVAWTTNEASDTQVEYGLTAAYGSKTALNTSLVTSHTATVTGLAVDTDYHFRVISKDKYGNMTVSQDYFVHTSANMAPTIAPINLNQLDADYSVDGYQVFQASPWTNITYSAKFTDPEGDAVTWQWLYKFNGGAETLFTQGSGLTAAAAIDYKNLQAGTYEWIVRASATGGTSEQSFTTNVLQGTWSSSITPTIFLDFDGNYIQNWSGYTNITTPRFSMDSDLTGFSWTEIVEAGKALMSVAEKFSPFNIGVSVFDYFFGNYATKEEEASARYSFYEQNKIMQVAIGGNSTWAGGNYGGIAQYNSWTSTLPNVVFAFEDNLASAAKYIAECSAHEVGHSFGLRHESLYDSSGVKTAEYYQGTSAWAPIMGSSYYATRGIWWNGEGNMPANSRTDEVAVLASKTNLIGFRPDDHGATMDSASALTLSGTSVSAKGIIEQLTDKDYFQFTTTAAGTVSFTGKIAAYGGMLDLALELRDSSGNLLATQDTTALGETLTMSLAAGSYYLVVRSHGRYGDLGQYFISGTVPAGTTSTKGVNALAGARDVFTHTKTTTPVYSGAGSAVNGKAAAAETHLDGPPPVSLENTQTQTPVQEEITRKQPSSADQGLNLRELLKNAETKGSKAPIVQSLLELEPHIPFDQQVRVNSTAAGEVAKAAFAAKFEKLRMLAEEVTRNNAKRALKTQELITGVKSVKF